MTIQAEKLQTKNILKSLCRVAGLLAVLAPAAACSVSEGTEDVPEEVSSEDADFRADLDGNHIVYWRTRDGGATLVQPVIDLWIDPSTVGITSRSPSEIILESQVGRDIGGSTVPGGGVLWFQSTSAPYGTNVGLEQYNIMLLDNGVNSVAAVVVIDHDFARADYPYPEAPGYVYLGR